MATDLKVYIGGVQKQAISANFQNKSLNQGHKTFTVMLDNLDNQYGGAFAPNDVVQIKIGTVTLFEGIIDSIKHQLEYKTKWNWMDYLRIAGRDNSFELAGYKYTKTWLANVLFTVMIGEALTDTGCPIDTTYIHGTGIPVGGHTIQDGYLLDLVRDLLAKANWYGDVPSAYPTQIDLFPMGSGALETNITLTDVLGIPNLIEADGLEIRNYIEVLGAAILTDPADMDEWTETVEGWAASGDLSLNDDTVPDLGTHSVQSTRVIGGGIAYAFMKYAKTFNLLYGQNTTLKFSFKVNDDLPDVALVQLFTSPTDYFWAYIPDISPDNWQFFNMQLGPNMEKSPANPEGIWTKVNNADWFNLTDIGFRVEWPITTTALWIRVDGLFLEPARPRGFAEDAGEGSSQETYGKREITIINDDLTTQAQVDAEATSKLEKLKEPATFIPHVICRGTDFIVGGVFKALPARFVTLDVPHLEFLDGKYRMENIVVNIVPYQDLNSGYDFMVEFDAIPHDALVDANRLYKTTKGQVTPKEII